jgi:hypothetical protein
MAARVNLVCTWHDTRAAISSEQFERVTENRLEKRKIFFEALSWFTN